MKTRIRPFILCCTLPWLLLQQACSSQLETPDLAQFAPVRNSLRAMNEVTTLTEFVEAATDASITGLLPYNSTAITRWFSPSLTDTDSLLIQLDTNLLLNDNRQRTGELFCTFPGSVTDTTNVFTLTFRNYTCNNIRYQGSLTITETAAATQAGARKKIITGTLTITFVSGAYFTIQPNLVRDFDNEKSFYTGSLNGTDENGKAFTCLVEEPLTKNVLNCQTSFYRGRYQLTFDNSEVKVWYGYNDDCNQHGFVELAEKQYNFWLYDY
jgi:hypothetical protein